ncbi:MAG TPA: AraC family transcriptional regulator [Allocoleopsis sp.]
MTAREYRVVDVATGTRRRVMLRQPVLSSSETTWNHFVLEQYNLPPSEIPEVMGLDHLILLHLSPPSLVEFREHGRSYSKQIAPGMICLTPANIPYATRWYECIEVLLLAFEPDLINRITTDSFSAQQTELALRRGQDDALIREIMLALKAELMAGYIAGSLYSESLVATLIIHLIRHYSVSKDLISNYPHQLSDHKIKLVIDYVHEHLDQHLKLAELAALAGVSQYYFLRLFKQHIGVTPYQYVVRQRVERAKQLLKQKTMPIADIALHCGFANQSHLTKLFRQVMGVTPKQYQADRHLRQIPDPLSDEFN